MNLDFWKFTGLVALVSSVFSIVDGMGGMNRSSVILYILLTLLTPILLRKVRHFEFTRTFDLNLWCYAYGWLFWNTFFFFGSGPLGISVNVNSRLAIMGIWFIVLVLAAFVMALTGLLLTKFFFRTKSHDWFDSTLDVCILALPVPMFLLGNIFYVDVQTNPMLVFMQDALIQFLQMVLALYFLVTMIIIVGRFYPRHGQYRWAAYGRIVVTALAWLAINGHLIYGYIPPIILEYIPLLMPVFRASVLVYITPAVIEVFVFAIAIGVGLLVERGLQNWHTKRVG